MGVAEAAMNARFGFSHHRLGFPCFSTYILVQVLLVCCHDYFVLFKCGDDSLRVIFALLFALDILSGFYSIRCYLCAFKIWHILPMDHRS